MDDVTLARALHVLAVVHWIGGVSMVTLVILPAIGRTVRAVDRLACFEAIEGPFSLQARVSIILAGASGFWMIHRMDLWHRFVEPGFWWMHAMVLVWLVFTLVLFVAEPLFLARWARTRAAIDPDGAFRLVLDGHRVLLAASAVTTGAAVLGAHGMLP